MKKITLVLAVLMFAATAMALTDVTITATPDGTTGNVDLVVTWSGGGSPPRAFAIDVNVTSDVNIIDVTGYHTGESRTGNKGYGIFPASFNREIDADDPNWDDANYTPVADACDLPGDTLGGIGTSGVTLELGSLYVDGNVPLSGSTLATITVDGSCTLCMTANVGRGKIVLEDGNEPNSASMPCVSVTVVQVCTVPNVVDVLEATAITDIENAGFVAGTPTTACSDSIAAGNVISTNPAAGATPTCGSTVEIVTSLGSPTVPDVVSVPTTEADAITAINAVVGLTAGTPTNACSDTVAAGNVISTDPAAGATTCGTTVEIVTSLGSPTVPDVTAMNEAGAIAAINAVVGLTAGTPTYECNDVEAAGEVLSQSPGAGVATCGTTVDLVISSGQPTVPNVVDETQADALTILGGVADITVNPVIYNGWSASVAVGDVMAQDPTGSCDCGTVVTLQVSSSTTAPANPIDCGDPNYSAQCADAAAYIANGWDPSEGSGGWNKSYHPYGDAMDNTEIMFQNYRVYNSDLALVLANWSKKAGPFPTGANPAADVAHNAEIMFQNYRVYNMDLARILCYWSAKDADLNANPRGLGPWKDADNTGWTCP